MANALYANYKNLIIGSSTAAHSFVDFDTDTINAALIDTGTYTVNLATHQDHADLTGIVGTVQTLASVTAGVVAAGTVDAADRTFTAVSGASIEAYVIYKNSGTSSTSPLVAYFDTASSGLPVTPNGGDITIAFNASGIIAF